MGIANGRLSRMDLSICILTHSQPVLLPQCVAACISEIDKAQLTGEIIIVDNASEDAYPQRLGPLSPMIRVIRNEQNLSFSAGNNQAIRIGRGRYALILNDDAILQEDSLKLMILALQSEPRIGAAAPKLLNPDGSVQSWATNKRLPHLRGLACELLGVDQRLRQNRWARDWLTLWRDPEKSAERDQVGGACVLIRRQALDEVGLFDEAFYYEFEDTDLCYRLRKAGWRILSVDNAHVIHHGSATFLRSWTALDFSAAYFKSASYFFKKHSSPLRYFLARSTLGMAFFLRISGRALRGIIRRRFTYEELTHKTHASLRLLRSILGVDAGRKGISGRKKQTASPPHPQPLSPKGAREE